jgi:aminomethyltransferase
MLQPLVSLDLSAIRRYWATPGEITGIRAVIARTGYTGEDGFELFVAAESAAAVWNACLETGREKGLTPVGLGARDTLRLEAGLLLYGNDIDTTISPLEARLQRLVHFDKGAFIGRDALLRQRSEGLAKQLVGLKMEGSGVPRHGYTLWSGNDRLGAVTSGTQSPTLGVGIALGYAPPSFCSVGQTLDVEIRNRRVPARVIALPFYRRGAR